MTIMYDVYVWLLRTTIMYDVYVWLLRKTIAYGNYDINESVFKL